MGREERNKGVEGEVQEPNRILDRILFLCRILQDLVQDFYQGYDEIREKLQGRGRKVVGWGVGGAE